MDPAARRHELLGDHTSDWAKILAFTSLAMVPAIIFYAFAERHIVSGLTGGSVKG